MVRRSGVVGRSVAFVVCVALAVTALPMSQVSAARSESDPGSDAAPAIDAGAESFEMPQVPPGMETVTHELPALDPVSVGLTLESAQSAEVEGVPVALRAVAEPLISGKPGMVPAEAPTAETPVVEDVRVVSLEASTVEALGGEVVGLGFLLELDDLGGRARLGDRMVESLVHY